MQGVRSTPATTTAGDGIRIRDCFYFRGLGVMLFVGFAGRGWSMRTAKVSSSRNSAGGISMGNALQNPKLPTPSTAGFEVFSDLSIILGRR